MNDYNLLGACGLYCGACEHYRASFPEGSHLNEDPMKNKDFTCNGCRSGKEHIHTGCADCSIRFCVDEKALQHCGECDKFPCEKITSFRNDGKAHHFDVISNAAEINSKGIESWLDEQKQHWQCGCGNPFSWYEDICINCSKRLNSYVKVK